MLKQSVVVDWRDARRQAARATIMTAAWQLVREDGLAALSLRELARRAGITTPTVYAYFESKNAIFDAMFGEAAESFAATKQALVETGDPLRNLVADATVFVEFCTADVPRYQLLFQHTIPGFTPSPASYAPAVRALEITRRRLARNGVRGARRRDLWTALMTGLVDQQISNDPGGQRWIRLIGDAVRMLLAHSIN